MEPKLTPQSEAILAKLREEVLKHHLTPEEMSQVRKGLSLIESFGVLSRFIIGLAAFIGAGMAIVNIWPGSQR